MLRFSTWIKTPEGKITKFKVNKIKAQKIFDKVKKEGRPNLLEEEGLEILAEAREKTGLPVVTEIMDPRDIGVPESKLVLGKHSGRHALGARIGELGYHIDDESLQGVYDAFKAEFSDKSVKLFGSGWAWLVKKPDGSVAIAQTSNAETPVQGDDIPLLTCDVWEHAYYIDYRNARPKYVEAFWKLVNWDFVASNFAA